MEICKRPSSCSGHNLASDDDGHSYSVFQLFTITGPSGFRLAINGLFRLQSPAQTKIIAVIDFFDLMGNAC